MSKLNVSISYDFQCQEKYGSRVNLENSCAVVIDVLRASTTICTLIELCNKIYITDCIEKANKIENSIKIGERNGKKIDGFNFGNSPVELLSNKLEIKKYVENGGNIVLTTTNGTRVLENISSNYTLIGSITNAKYVSKKACEIAFKSNKDITLVPAHRGGKFAIEDYICAGLIADYILKYSKEEIDSESFEGLIPSRTLTKTDWVRKVFESNSAKNLKILGYYEDILFSVSKNSQKSVGVYDKSLGIITSI